MCAITFIVRRIDEITRNAPASCVIGVVRDKVEDTPIGIVKHSSDRGFEFESDPEVVGTCNEPVSLKIFSRDWDAVRVGYLNGGCTFDNAGICRCVKVSMTIEKESAEHDVKWREGQFERDETEAFHNAVSSLTNGRTDLLSVEEFFDRSTEVRGSSSSPRYDSKHEQFGRNALPRSQHRRNNRVKRN